MDKWMKRKYNACYRLKSKGVQIKTPSKTIYGDPDIIKNFGAAKILLNDFHFVIQTELFL